MFRRLDVLKNKFGFNPTVIYDIGAHVGDWTRECKKLYPDAVYYQFEGNTDHHGRLLDNPTFEILGDVDDKPVDYYKSKTAFSTGNSIFKENTKFFNDTNLITETRLMKRLDTIVERKKHLLPSFIKLDTQGSELLILKGAPRCVESAEIIMLEASVAEYNTGSPLLLEVLKFMDDLGFILFDFADLHYIHGALAQVDLLFCKKGSKYLLKTF